MPKESKNETMHSSNAVQSFPENSLKIRSEFWVVRNDVIAVISIKMLVKHSHFRDVLSVFRLF